MHSKARQMSKPPSRTFTLWRFCLLSVALMAPISLVIAQQPSAANGEHDSRPIQKATIDPVTGLVYGLPPSLNGIGMMVDANGHPRAFCADPADSLAPAAVRDAIQPATSRLRYE